MLFDAAQSAYWDIAPGMRNSDPSLLIAVFELCMAALSGNFEPTISLQQADNISAIHVYLYTLIGYLSTKM
ncbi:hypothetical protein A8146_24930 [Mesorhizobium loti]|nr:hypothetical protein A8146_24930 [Mesorhizobium loti]